jgi:hypothetical protein
VLDYWSLAVSIVLALSGFVLDTGRGKRRTIRGGDISEQVNALRITCPPCMGTALRVCGLGISMMYS